MELEISAIFLYNRIEDGICIYACRSWDSIAVVPEMIDGLPVVELASYVFSDHRSQAVEGIWMGIEGGVESELDLLPPLLSGDRVERVILPPTIRKIGNYAFYNCYHLVGITGYSTIADLGSGLFTGCGQVCEIDMTIVEGEKSCLKELLAELRQRITVWYRSAAGVARLIFPEYYEEAVENTPARILFTQMHGCGHRYRYCFVQTQFQFKEYDAQFPYLLAQEQETMVLELILGRMFYPVALLESARQVYRRYLREHWQGAVRFVLNKKDMDEMKMLAAMADENRECLDDMIYEANRVGWTEAAGFLLSDRQERFQVKRKRFIL